MEISRRDLEIRIPKIPCVRSSPGKTPLNLSLRVLGEAKQQANRKDYCSGAQKDLYRPGSQSLATSRALKLCPLPLPDMKKARSQNHAMRKYATN